MYTWIALAYYIALRYRWVHCSRTLKDGPSSRESEFYKCGLFFGDVVVHNEKIHTFLVVWSVWMGKDEVKLGSESLEQISSRPKQVMVTGIVGMW